MGEGKMRRGELAPRTRGTHTGEVEYRRDLHPDAISHFAIVIGDMPLVPESWPLVDLGDQPIRVHLHLVPHADAALETWPS